MPATQRELDFAESIEIHHNRLIEKINNSILAMRTKRNNDNREWINNQIKYWENVIGGLKWSTHLAKSKASRK
jgi:hypothetical protein